MILAVNLYIVLVHCCTMLCTEILYFKFADRYISLQFGELLLSQLKTLNT